MTAARECALVKKKIRDLKPGTPFKYKGRVFIMDDTGMAANLVTGEVYGTDEPFFVCDINTLVTVCKRIRKSDIKERK